MSPALAPLVKGRKYLKPGNKAPDGVKTYTGKRSGRYYLTEDVHSRTGPKTSSLKLTSTATGHLTHPSKTGHYEIRPEHGGDAYHLYHHQAGQEPKHLASAGGNPIEALHHLKKHIRVAEARQSDLFSFMPVTKPDTRDLKITPDEMRNIIHGKNHPVFPVTKEAFAHIDAAGSGMVNQDYETLTAIGPDGKPLFSKDGSATGVSIEETHYHHFYNARVVHNHPSLPVSTSFSGPDLSFAMETGVSEMWIYARDGTKYLVLPPEGESYFGEKSGQEQMEQALEQAETDTRGKLTKMITDGKMSVQEANITHADVVTKLLHARGILRYYADRPGGKS